MWVDQFDTLGMGKDMIIVTGTTSDSMLIFNPKTETWTVFRLPYSDAVLHARPRWTHRQPERRMERARHLDELQLVHCRSSPRRSWDL